MSGDAITVILAIVCGLIASGYLVLVRFNQLMMVIYHAPFRFWRPYLALYDGLENKYTYELLGGEKRFGSHTKFLKKYRSFRPEATKRFKALWDSYARKVGRDYGLVLIVGLALLWSVWWAFIVPVLIVIVVRFFLNYFLQKNGPTFYAETVLSILFSKHNV